MNANLSKSRNGNSAQGRVRGIVLSPQGWQRFQAAKQSTESEETWGKHLTQEDLSDRTGLCLNTLYRVLKRELGVDRQSLEHLFRGFGLELTRVDYTSPVAPGEEPESPRASIKDDWDDDAAVQNIRPLVPPYSPVADISIIAVERLPSEGGPFSGAPDWLIEIRSPDQSTLDLQNNILHCLSNGTQLAWLIDISCSSFKPYCQEL